MSSCSDTYLLNKILSKSTGSELRESNDRISYKPLGRKPAPSACIGYFSLILRSFSLDKTALTAYLSLPKYRNYILFCKIFYNRIFNFSNKSCRRVSETGPAISSPIGPKTAETTSVRRFVHMKQLHSAAPCTPESPGAPMFWRRFNDRTAGRTRSATHNWG